MNVKETLKRIEAGFLQQEGFKSWGIANESIWVSYILDNPISSDLLEQLDEAAQLLLKSPDNSAQKLDGILNRKIVDNIRKRLQDFWIRGLDTRKSLEIEVEESIPKILNRRSKIDISESARDILSAYAEELKAMNSMDLLSADLISICKFHLILELMNVKEIMTVVDSVVLGTWDDKEKLGSRPPYVNSPFDELSFGDEINSIIVELRNAKTFTGTPTRFGKISDFLSVAFPGIQFTADSVRKRYDINK